MRRCTTHGGQYDAAYGVFRLKAGVGRHGDEDCGELRATGFSAFLPCSQLWEAEMTTFDKRKDELEKKYFHEEELLFKAKSRRNRLFGLSIAERLGKRGEEATEYARQFVVTAALNPAGDEGLVKLVVADLEAAGRSVPVQELNRILEELLERAKEEIQAE